MVALKRVAPVEDRIALPQFINTACSDALAFFCAEREITDAAQIRELAALTEETAQRVHRALIERTETN